jgi:hypothetical protein
MAIRVVWDDFTIINTTGVRFAEKIDQNSFASTPDRYRLRVTYKGDVLDFCYPDKTTRDAQYDALKAAMTAPFGRRGNER